MEGGISSDRQERVQALNREFIVPVTVAAQAAAAADATTFAYYDDRTGSNPSADTVATQEEQTEVLGGYYTPSAAIAGANSPASASIELVDLNPNGSVNATLGTLAFVAGTNGVANVPQAIPGLSGTMVAPGHSLAVVSHQVGGTGLALPAGKVQLHLVRQGIV